MAIGTTIKIGMDSRTVQRGLRDIGKGFSNLNKIGGEMVTTFAKWGAGIGIAAIAGITALTAKLIQIGETGRAVDARLKNVVRQMGLFGDSADTVSDRLADLADTQSRLLGIDDDVIANTMSKLLTFHELAKTANVVGGAFDRASQAALDMAAMGFGEAEQNAVQLGKALQDPIAGLTALRRTGITFTNEQREVIAALIETGQRGEAMNVMLKAIETQVGGTAEATAVSSEKIKKSLGQIVEEFAKKFTVGFDSLPGAFEAAFESIKSMAATAGDWMAKAISDSLQGNTDKFELMGIAIGNAIGAGVNTAWNTFGQKMWGNIKDIFTAEKNWSSLSDIQGETGISTKDLFDYNMQKWGVSDAFKAASAGNAGMVPGGGNMRYARPGEDTTGFEDVYNYETKEWSKATKVSNTLLEKIELNTRAGAKF